ncbi:DNA gyrase subunit A [Helcococcus kunzii]|uniref:DNA gyrase subunit A n=1 Tax=Helcococcus kunzii TaxID=40091 RepID=UPI001C96C8AF|nr:DNA gyrase subunit A [Helcococcus kunzii]MCT1796837.1 DNA gyrase subunit A [Helcococcus kunzii]MCT1988395.1 DNA gyrase subunit A [Helcococcus kunzii]QZO76199.1 DNA gyrase subunit A [Helcococcus kunzii]
MSEFNHVNIIPQDIEQKMKQAYLDYSMSVIVARALPDVRDGLKPVHRRILYGMNQLGLLPNKPHRKSARLVGEVMGRFHPHGDSAIYQAVVRLAQDFSTRYPLADGQGNFGSMDGDGAAAQRYTEVRMTKLTLEMLKDINKDTVDFQPNFDEEEVEPKVLPARFPNLLVNGSSGIAVGMATNMAPHNLGEVVDGCIAYIDDNDITVEGLMKHIKGPDFPTGANIMGKKPIIDAYKTGRGKVKLRAEAHIEEYKSKHVIVVTEIPYEVNRSKLVMSIADLVKDKKIEGISDLRDESNRMGTRIVIETKRDANPNVVLNNLYKQTQMSTTFGIINLALVDGVPKVLSLKELIHYYIEHQKEVVTRRTKFDLDKAEARAHILEGLRIAYDNIDEIIKIIRSNYDDDDIKAEFTKRFGLTDIQGQAILDMQLKRLSGLNVEKIEEEYAQLQVLIKDLKEILANESKLMDLIKEELLEIKEKFADGRLTRIKSAVGDVEEEDLIEEEEVIITLTNQGYIKRLPADTYKVQNRGGRGVTGMTTKDDDFVQNLIVTSTHSTILFFTNKGKVYKKRAFEIKEGKRQSKGQAIINILQLDIDESISAVIAIDEFDEDKYIVLATRNGKIKRMSSSEFLNIRTTGIIAITLTEGDELIAAREVQDDSKILMVTENGQSIIFEMDDVRPMGRTAQGVKGISLSKGDKVVDAAIIDDNEYIFIVTEKGYGKKTLIKHYKAQKRSGKGVKTYKLTNKTGKIVSTKLVNMEDQVLLVSANSEVIRLNVKDISTMGRATQGVRLKKVRSDEENIVACAKYIEEAE